MKLKPCPFCGGEAKLTVYSHNEIPTDWSIRCQSCGGSIYEVSPNGNQGDLKALAIAKWNRRPDDAHGPHLDVSNHDVPGDIPFAAKVRRLFERKT